MLCISDTQKIKEIGGTGKHARSKFLRDDDDDDVDAVGDDDAGGDGGDEVPQFYIYTNSRSSAPAAVTGIII